MEQIPTYPNLAAEMARKGYTYKTIARTLTICDASALNKLALWNYYEGRFRKDNGYEV